MILRLLGLFCCWAVQALPGVDSLNQCPDVILNSAFENQGNPSVGTGGLYPGAQDISVSVPGIGLRTYYLYVPSAYDPIQAMPLLVLWHGQVIPGGAEAEAQSTRSFWQQTAELNNVIIMAQASSGSSGGWIPGTDSQILAAVIGDIQNKYNVENTRIYGWGFSAGAHLMHAIGLNNADFFAGYIASAGTLSNFAGTAALFQGQRNIAAYVSVGTQDFLFADAQNEFALFQQAGWVLGDNYWFDAFDGGHEVQSSLPQRAWDAICTATVLD